ncbi:MAG: hypothetical protein IT538_01115 [Variibacter sp.]|nr:hypothetical protein [Variibacter sp.]
MDVESDALGAGAGGFGAGVVDCANAPEIIRPLMAVAVSKDLIMSPPNMAVLAAVAASGRSIRSAGGRSRAGAIYVCGISVLQSAGHGVLKAGAARGRNHSLSL